MNDTKKDKFYRRALGLTAIGAALFVLPLFFLHHQILSGVFGICGLILMISGARLAASWKQVLGITGIYYLAYILRFLTVFGFGSLMLSPIPLFLLWTVISGSGFFIEFALGRGKPHLFFVLLFPLTYTVANLVFLTTNIGNIQNICNYVICIPGIRQNLRWFSETGLTFVIMVIVSFLAFVPIMRGRMRVVAAGIGVLLVVSLFVAGGLTASRDEEAPVLKLKVALGTLNKVPFYGGEDAQLSEDEQMTLFFEQMRKASEEGADLVVFHEEYYLIDAEREEFILEYIRATVAHFQIPVLLPVEIRYNVPNRKDVNKAYFFDASGKLLNTYVKNNLVPMVEAGDYVDGPEQPGIVTCDFHGQSVKIAIIICFDVNDSYYLRKIPKDTQLLLVPSWEWNTVNEEQRRMSVRAIEVDATMLKHTYEGFSYVVTPQGRVVKELDNRGVYEKVRMVTVPIYGK